LFNLVELELPVETFDGEQGIVYFALHGLNWFPFFESSEDTWAKTFGNSIKGIHFLRMRKS
jgi:hypothetical protein